MRYKLTIAYDGTNYSGWQVQKNTLSISKLIQNALETILRKETNLTGSGRTDAGVHANGQVAHFDTDISLSKQRLFISLNALLPPDIRIMQIEEVPTSFHARYSALSKTYHYHLHLSSYEDPFSRLYSHLISSPLDLKQMEEGAKILIGTHDFTSFANVKKEEIDATRTIYRIDIIEKKGKVQLEFEGNGFLYKMVRNLTGALIDVGRGKISPQELLTILDAKDRTRGPASAPAKGLFLHFVKYPETIQNEAPPLLKDF